MDDLKTMMKSKKIPMWKVAYKIGVSEMTILRWLRIYDKEHHRKIFEAIETIEKENTHDEIN